MPRGLETFWVHERARDVQSLEALVAAVPFTVIAPRYWPSEVGQPHYAVAGRRAYGIWSSFRGSGEPLLTFLGMPHDIPFFTHKAVVRDEGTRTVSIEGTDVIINAVGLSAAVIDEVVQHLAAVPRE